MREGPGGDPGAFSCIWTTSENSEVVAGGRLNVVTWCPTATKGTAMAKTKAAKNITAGDWVTFGGLAWLAGEPWTEDGTTYIPFGYSVEEFKPNARLTLHQD